MSNIGYPTTSILRPDPPSHLVGVLGVRGEVVDDVAGHLLVQDVGHLVVVAVDAPVVLHQDVVGALGLLQQPRPGDSH